MCWKTTWHSRRLARAASHSKQAKHTAILGEKHLQEKVGQQVGSLMTKGLPAFPATNELALCTCTASLLKKTCA